MSELSKTNICPFCKNSKAYAVYHEREDMAMNAALAAATEMVMAIRRADLMRSVNPETLKAIRDFEVRLKIFHELPMDMTETAERVMELERSLSEGIED